MQRRSSRSESQLRQQLFSLPIFADAIAFMQDEERKIALIQNQIAEAESLLRLARRLRDATFSISPNTPLRPIQDPKSQAALPLLEVDPITKELELPFEIVQEYFSNGPLLSLQGQPINYVDVTPSPGGSTAQLLVNDVVVHTFVPEEPFTVHILESSARSIEVVGCAVRELSAGFAAYPRVGGAAYPLGVISEFSVELDVEDGAVEAWLQTPFALVPLPTRLSPEIVEEVVESGLLQFDPEGDVTLKIDGEVAPGATLNAADVAGTVTASYRAVVQRVFEGGVVDEAGNVTLSSPQDCSLVLVLRRIPSSSLSPRVRSIQ